MSKRLFREAAFIELLLNTNKQQAYALLETATLKQVLVLIEIFINLHSLKIPKQTENLLGKRKRLFQPLISNQVKVNRKQELIRQHRLQILDTLRSVRPRLLELLK